MVRKVAILALMVILAALATYAFYQLKVGVPPTPTQQGFKIVDLANRTVVVPVPVKRVIVLTSAEAEILYTLGVGDKIVGIGKYIPRNDYLPAYIKNKTIVGSTFAGVNIEAAMALKPDLVLTQYGYGKTVEIVKKFEEAGIPVVCTQLKEFDDLIACISLFGKIFNREEKAKEIADFVNSVFQRIREIASKIPEENKTRVLMMSSIKEGKITVYARGSAWASLVELAGAHNVAFEEEFPTPWPKVSLEKIIDWNPDVILVIGWSRESLEKALKTIKEGEEWQVIKAVREGRVYGVLAGSKFGAFLEWSPRLAVGAVQVAQLVQPEYFKELDWKEVANELLSRFYGLNFTKVVMDDQGRNVTIPYVVERVALLDGGMGGLLALGAKDRFADVFFEEVANEFSPSGTGLNIRLSFTLPGENVCAGKLFLSF